MTKVRKLVSKVTIINMYYSFIYPYLTYGSKLWGNNYYSPIHDVVKLQNKAIRIINDVPIMENNLLPLTMSIYLGILKFPDIVKLHPCLLYFDLLCEHKPSNLVIPLLSEQHSYTTRNVSLQQLYIPLYRTNIRKFSPNIIGCYFWNDLPLSIRSKHSKKLFKCSLFSHYLSQY